MISTGYQAEMGIGAINMARIQGLYDLAVESGIREAGSVDIAKVATNQIVNKKGAWIRYRNKGGHLAMRLLFVFSCRVWLWLGVASRMIAR